MADGKETYLGDGLYASFDGYQFRLRAPNFDGDQVVYLDPGVVIALLRMVQAVWPDMIETFVRK